MKRDKEGHYIKIKGSIQEEDIAVVNIYAPNIGTLQSVRQMLTSMKGEINNNTTMWETWVQSLGWEDPLEKEMAIHSSILAWRIPWMEELGGLQSTGRRAGHD